MEGEDSRIPLAILRLARARRFRYNGFNLLRD